MSFQIHALDSEAFEPFYALDAQALAWAGVRRMTVTDCPGYPCRVSLRDADIGETVLLMNYQHQSQGTCYRASHAIFVRDGAKTARPDRGEVPGVLTARPISLRAFDARHDMVAADLAEGSALHGAIRSLLARRDVAYLHLHNAKPGCYAARAERADI